MTKYEYSHSLRHGTNRNLCFFTDIEQFGMRCRNCTFFLEVLCEISTKKYENVSIHFVKALLNIVFLFLRQENKSKNNV